MVVSGHHGKLQQRVVNIVGKVNLEVLLCKV